MTSMRRSIAHMKNAVLLLALAACSTHRAPSTGPLDGPRSSVPAASGESAVRFDPPPRSGPAPSGLVVYADGRTAGADAAGRDALPPPGRAISLDLVDAELTSVLRLVGEVADLDFVVDDGVQASVTVQMHDVPWNHALAAILASHGLAAVPMDGGGVHIVAHGG